MEKKQTAVEWLVRKLSTELIGEIPLHKWDEIRNTVQQAKEIEKQQIIEAFKHGELPPFFVNYDAEQYYNKTYGKTEPRP